MKTMTSNARGWDIFWDGKEWFYSDTLELYDDSRPCRRCKRFPTPEGYDVCLGHIPGAKSACCGHGVTKEILLWNHIQKG
jgi:hypothetical protein